MKKLLTILLTLGMLIGLCGCEKADSNSSDVETIKKNGVLRVGMECDYVPFNWMITKPTDTSEPIQAGGYADGYDVYFSRMVAEALGVKTEIVKIEWDGLTLALESGTIDCIIAGMSPTAERKVTVDFTNPYYGGEKVLIIRKDSVYANATAISDFSGAKLAHQHNNVYGSLLEQIADCQIVNVYDSNPLMIEATLAGDIDGFVEDIDVGKSVAGANGELMYVRFEEGKGFDITDVVDSIACRKGSDLVDFINTNVLSKLSDQDKEDLMNKATEAAPNNQ